MCSFGVYSLFYRCFFRNMLRVCFYPVEKKTPRVCPYLRFMLQYASPSNALLKLIKICQNVSLCRSVIFLRIYLATATNGFVGKFFGGIQISRYSCTIIITAHCCHLSFLAVLLACVGLCIVLRDIFFFQLPLFGYNLNYSLSSENTTQALHTRANETGGRGDRLKEIANLAPLMACNTFGIN